MKIRILMDGLNMVNILSKKQVSRNFNSRQSDWKSELLPSHLVVHHSGVLQNWPLQ